MRIKYTDSHSIYTAVSYDMEEYLFRLKGQQPEALEYSPVLRLDHEHDPQNFFYILLSNDNPSCTENSIYQVYVDHKRIGWIFPIQSLLSDEHDYSENAYFLKYAYVALHLLLEDIEDIDSRETPSRFLLSDYYDARKNILVVDKENIADFESFSIDDYVVSLYSYGYAYAGRGNAFAELPDPVSRTRLNLKAVSKQLTMIPTINYLFKEQLPAAEDERIRFYLCYQVIELLISVVFEDQFQLLLEKLKADPEAIFDQRDKLSDIVREKHRIRLLFNDYVSCATDHHSDLDTACKKLLELNGRETSISYFENLYSVRCLLVHKLYSLKPDSYQILQDINRSFLDVVMDILFSFKKPV